MKPYLLSFLTVSVLLGADEIERIESIVKDIADLRSQYEQCREQLKTKALVQNPFLCAQEQDKISLLTHALKDEQQKNTLLLSELQTVQNSQTFHKDLELKILKLENSKKKQEKIINSKENELEELRKKYEELFLTQEKEIIALKNQIKSRENPKIVKEKKVALKQCEEANPFPKLVMRGSHKQKKQQAKGSATKIVEEQTQPLTYRLKTQSDIYKSVDGEIKESWEQQRSFTSDRRYKNWIKITGYFVERKWRKAKEDLWVLEENVLQRD